MSQSNINDAVQKLKEFTDAIGSMGDEAAIERAISPEKIAEIDVTAKRALQAGGGLVGMVFSTLMTFGAEAVSYFLEKLTEVRKDTAEQQAKISAAVLSEFLACDIEVPTPGEGGGPEAILKVCNSIGTSLHERLEQEFTRGGAVDEDSGAAAAKTFSGFAVNFATQNAMISTLADCLSSHYLGEFKELGVEAARNLGIGRLQRQALGPLIKATIADPYTRKLNQKYRQSRLSPGDACKAYFRGAKDKPTLMTELSRHGYPDDDCESLIQQHMPRLAPAALETLVRWGKMTQDDAVKHLVDSGIPHATAELLIIHAQYSRLETLEQTWLSQLEHLAKHGFISQTAFAETLDKLHLTDDEKTVEKRIIGDFIESRFKRPGWSEVVKAFRLGKVQLDYVQSWLQNEGYDQEDSELMLAELYLRPSWAQVKEAHKIGQVTEDYVAKWLTDHGYNQEDALVEEYVMLNAEATATAKAKAKADAAAAKAAAAAAKAASTA